MQLDAPLIRQPKDSVECGIAALAMLLGYHGIKTSPEGLKAGIEVGATGICFPPQLGSCLLRKGFEVESITLNPGLFTSKDKDKDSAELLTHFQALYAGADSDKKKKALDYFMDFLRNGGRIKVKVPDKKDIAKEIKGKRPVLALLTANFLFGVYASAYDDLDNACLVTARKKGLQKP